MSHTPHDLASEFPMDAERLSALKAANAHVARLIEQYESVNATIHRAETDIEPMSDEHQTALRRERMTLKDQIARALREPV